MQFQRATRRKSFIKIALTGASGSGKTYSGLKLASGLGKRVAIVDTENGSGSLYADLTEYDALEIGPPYTTERYQEAIEAAVEAGYDVLLIDSLTHAWAGEGGLLAQKEALDRQGGNQFTNWAPITRKQEALKAAILQAPIHVIATMRSKVEYVIEQQGDRRSAPRKVGMAPIQRDGMEYEFTLVFDLGADHSAIPSKDRTSLFDGFHGLLNATHGRRIAEWLESGAEPAPAPQAEPPVQNATQRVQTPNTAPQAKAAPVAPHPPAGAMVCSWHPCANPLTKGQYEISLRAYNAPLCPAHQKKAAAGETIPAAPAPAPEPTASAEQQERWRRLKREADDLGVNVEPFRPTAETAPEDVDALLAGLESLLAEVREKGQVAA